MQNLTIPNATLQSLLSNQQIVAVEDTEQLLYTEKTSLSKLRSRQLQEHSQKYLNAYDRLFRHVSILLLEHGYALTDIKPHQTLRQICQKWQADNTISRMINERHRLKKFQQTPLPLDNQAINGLYNLLNAFDKQDAMFVKAAGL